MNDGLKAIAADERGSQSITGTGVPRNTNEASSDAETAANMAAARSATAAQTATAPRQGTKIGRVIELQTWESFSHGQWKVTLTPCKHWGARVLRDEDSLELDVAIDRLAADGLFERRRPQVWVAVAELARRRTGVHLPDLVANMVGNRLA